MGSRVILVHGFGSNPGEHWFSEAKMAFEMRWYEITVPHMPESSRPQSKRWVDTLRAYMPDERTILIGHSLGGTAILRYLETAEMGVYASMHIAAPLWSIGEEAIDGFFVPDFDWRKIRAMAKHFLLLYQTRDPIVPLEHGKELARSLGVPLMTADGDDHFDKLDVNWLVKTIASMS